MSTAEQVPVLAVLDAVESYIAARLNYARQQWDKANRKGKEPHPELTAEAERAIYMREHLVTATVKVGNLIASVRAERRAFESNSAVGMIACRKATDAAVAACEGHQ